MPSPRRGTGTNGPVCSLSRSLCGAVPCRAAQAAAGGRAAWRGRGGAVRVTFVRGCMRRKGRRSPATRCVFLSACTAGGIVDRRLVHVWCMVEYRRAGVCDAVQRCVYSLVVSSVDKKNTYVWHRCVDVRWLAGVACRSWQKLRRLRVLPHLAIWNGSGK